MSGTGVFRAGISAGTCRARCDESAASVTAAATRAHGAAVKPWISPVPRGVGRNVRVYRPGIDLRVIASFITERAWRARGVRVFRWPCGTVAIAPVAAEGDVQLSRDCEPFLFATYARHGLLGYGPMLVDVLHDLNWAKAT